MKFIYTEELKKKIIKKLNYFYIFLGEDLILLNENQKIILNYAKKKGFLEYYIINIEKNKDWNEIITFYKSNNLFFKKKILIINFIIKKLNTILIKNIKTLLCLENFDILTILKFNQLSKNFKKYFINSKYHLTTDIIWCFTQYGVNFKKWLKYNIQEKNIKITENAFMLLNKYYEGNTLFIKYIFNILKLTYNHKKITSNKIKNIINQFSIFNPSDWVNAIFQNNISQAFYILDTFRKQKYNLLILIRSLQKDLLILLNLKRKKKININTFLKENNIFFNRVEFFNSALTSINFNNFFKVIRILLQIDIKIKIEYNDDVWVELKTLVLLLSSIKQKS